MSTQRNVVKSLIAYALMAIASGMADAGVGLGIDPFLRWISMGSGAVLIASVLVDTLFRLIPSWDEKARKWVRYAAGVLLALGLVLGAEALLQRPDLVERIKPIYKVVFGMLSVWLAMQMRNSKMELS
ncbi:MAG: hypothetical protein P8Z41_12505 [Anaerolineales bacterium]